MPPLLAGQVDAVMDGYRNVELIQLEAEGHPVQAWFPEENGVPAYDELIYETARDRADDPRLPRFLAAISGGDGVHQGEAGRGAGDVPEVAHGPRRRPDAQAVRGDGPVFPGRSRASSTAAATWASPAS